MAGEEEKIDNAEGKTTLNGVEIFRVGTWQGSREVKVTSSMLDEIVSNFKSINQVSGYGVPLKLGHLTKPGDPAYGWATDVRRVNDTLVADFSDVDPQIVDAIGKKRYTSVSVELYPTVKYEGKAFHNVLGGVAALGAEWPAVKGLKPLTAQAFAEESEVLELREEEAVNFTQEQHDAILNAAVEKAKADTKTEMSAAVDTAKAEVKSANDAKVVAETALKTFRDDADKSKIDEVIAAAEKAGVIVPANKDKIAKLAASVLKVTDASERAEQIGTFAEIVAGLKPKVTFGEKLDGETKADRAEDGDNAATEVAAKANALMSEKPELKLDFAGAVKHVLNSDPDLKAAYAAQF